MAESISIWKLFAGLGIFLFGMFIMEESIRVLAGRSFKKFIREKTTGRTKSILAGASVTAILQSSSAVSLMVLAFVGAGIMAMENAIGVIVGSNVGTTLTAWIVATFGFSLNIEEFSLPLIAIGGLVLILLGKSARYSNISKLLVGFGFLFMGLDYMKSSVEELTAQFDISSISQYGLPVFFLFGLVSTAIMQSSSASIAIVLTAINAQIIGFEQGAVIVIGANVGTTATVLIGGIGSTQIKRRVAFSHLLFNVFTAIAAFAMLIPLTWIVKKTVGVDPVHAVMGVALFHTMFNVLGVILIFPFIGLFARLLLKLFPDKEKKLTEYLQNLTPQVSDAAVQGIRKEVLHLVEEALRHNLSVLKIDQKLVFTEQEDGEEKKARWSLDERYENLKLLQAEIFNFAAKVQSGDVEERDSDDLNRYLHCARVAMHSAKSLRDIKHDFDSFDSSDNEFMYNKNMEFRKRLISLYLQVIDLIPEEKHETIAGSIARIRQHLTTEDKAFVKEIGEATTKELLKELDVSTLLMANRAFIQSAVQILSALRETLLTKEELQIYEGIQEGESAGQSLQ